MTGRDRLVVIGLVVLALLAGGWLLLVSPERQQAAQAQAKVEGARAQLQSAQAQAASERSAQARYTSAYVSVVRLGKAVPPLEEVPALIYELDQASHQRDIDFNSISSGTSSGAGGSAASSAAAAAAVTPAAFTQMPFTFIFNGSFFGLAQLLGQIDGFAKTTVANSRAANGGGASAAATFAPTGVQVSGRLLTIQGISLTLGGQSSSVKGSSGSGSAGSGGSGSGSAGHNRLTATITATAYVLPASQGLTAGATPAGPAGSSATPGQQAASAAASPSSPTSPAVVEGAP